MADTDKREGFGEKAYFKKVFRLKKLEGLFLFVTSRCNSNCRTCFYKKELNQKTDLTYEQIARISETTPKFDKLWVSGGEPFMRDRFVDIIEMFYRNNGISAMNLPTNGLRTDRVVEWTGEILERCPDLVVHLNFSVDGFAPAHDSIRGVRGGFHRVMKSMEGVERAYGDHARLHFNAATVLTPENYDQLIDLSRYLYKRFPKLGFHLSEPARGESPDPSVQTLTRDDVERMHERFRPVLDTTSDRLFKDMRGWQRYLGNLSYTGLITYMFDLTEKNHDGPHPWGMKCPAGKTTIVIDADGSFRACEIRDRVGHLKDYDYNLEAALYSQALKHEITAIGGGKRANCWCTHGCWISSALKFAPWVLLTKVPGAYKKHKKNSPGSLDLAAVDLKQLEEKYHSTAPVDRAVSSSK